MKKSSVLLWVIISLMIVFAIVMFLSWYYLQDERTSFIEEAMQIDIRAIFVSDYWIWIMVIIFMGFLIAFILYNNYSNKENVEDIKEQRFIEYYTNANINKIQRNDAYIGCIESFKEKYPDTLQLCNQFIENYDWLYGKNKKENDPEFVQKIPKSKERRK